jgi:hypothetical protein
MARGRTESSQRLQMRNCEKSTESFFLEKLSVMRESRYCDQVDDRVDVTNLCMSSCVGKRRSKVAMACRAARRTPRTVSRARSWTIWRHSRPKNKIDNRPIKVTLTTERSNMAPGRTIAAARAATACRRTVAPVSTHRRARRASSPPAGAPGTLSSPRSLPGVPMSEAVRHAWTLAARVGCLWASWESSMMLVRLERALARTLCALSLHRLEV